MAMPVPSLPTLVCLSGLPHTLHNRLKHVLDDNPFLFWSYNGLVHLEDMCLPLRYKIAGINLMLENETHCCVKPSDFPLCMGNASSFWERSPHWNRTIIFVTVLRKYHDVYRALSTLAREMDFIQTEVYKNCYL